MTTNPVSLWEPEARWAVQEWSVLFDAERQKLFAGNGAVNQSSTYVRLGAAAKRSFEIVADQLLHRVRDLLAKRDVAEQIGTSDAATETIVGPIERRAREAVPNGENVAAARGFLNVTMLTGPLQQTERELRAAVATLRTAICNEIETRLAQLAAAKQTAAQRTVSERWQRWHQLSGIVRNFWPLAVAIVVIASYVGMHFKLFDPLWHAIANKLSTPHQP